MWMISSLVTDANCDAVFSRVEWRLMEVNTHHSKIAAIFVFFCLLAN